MLRIDVPKPSEWTKHDLVEEIATEWRAADDDALVDDRVGRGGTWTR